ncbi:thioesterase family protein [Stackebrandtia nassauensis]|uniref:Fluoroacetyl-CoA-specific thioesterase-like domain-containing protein n=1 Tax=Stackebrandtia nassauensis (strain DSM 44728 / CIP 108903 / NRRL B-16338 / NBRC 102104 / LLR-40K-21) TaxID=446470 RepID=D3QAD8_STANL|nr:hotdog domain-containing protein [Stackebrandtia nassauensis]ADD42721.1 conserved hypothetical protein [Stackebrandtia nassauensis DSM 44728]
MRDLTELDPTALQDVSGRVETIVTQADTAQSLGSGDVPVLGTPRVLALAEAAIVMSLTRRIPTTMTTVGTRVRLRHLAAVPLGRMVAARARLRGRDGNKLTFDISLVDGDNNLVADGEIERALVDRADFLTRLD